MGCLIWTYDLRMKGVMDFVTWVTFESEKTALCDVIYSITRIQFTYLFTEFQFNGQIRRWHDDDGQAEDGGQSQEKADEDSPPTCRMKWVHHFRSDQIVTLQTSNLVVRSFQVIVSRLELCPPFHRENKDLFLLCCFIQSNAEKEFRLKQIRRSVWNLAKINA